MNVKPRPCPFCADPMRINNAGLIDHVDQTPGCPIAASAWPAERFLLAWNMRPGEDLLRHEAYSLKQHIAESDGIHPDAPRI